VTGKWDLEKGHFAHVFMITGELFPGQLLYHLLGVVHLLSSQYRRARLFHPTRFQFFVQNTSWAIFGQGTRVDSRQQIK
jgi:hypothetical protein